MNRATVTRNLLHYCYTCPDAHNCTTEEMCLKCWEEKGLLDEASEENETKRLLKQYPNE